VKANVAAIELADRLDVEQRPATTREQVVLAGWSGWGAVPEVFELPARPEWVTLAGDVERHLDRSAWKAARASTPNAHYTSTAIAAAMWDTVRNLGFTGGRVLEPGCGSGNFLGLAPTDLPVDLVGVEQDPTTARIARHLYPHARIVTDAFEATNLPDASFDLVIGNVPFADVAPYDPVHNQHRWPLHSYFIAKSVALTKPGGIVAVITSRYTLDSTNERFRVWLGERAELVGAVRLPRGAFQAVAGTSAICDILVLRTAGPGVALGGHGWLHSNPFTPTLNPFTPTVNTVTARDAARDAAGDVAGRREPDHDPGNGATEPDVTGRSDGGLVRVNEWFLADPVGRVAGDLGVGHGPYRGNDLTVTATGPLTETLPRLLRNLSAPERIAAATLPAVPETRETAAASPAAVGPTPTPDDPTAGGGGGGGGLAVQSVDEPPPVAAPELALGRSAEDLPDGSLVSVGPVAFGRVVSGRVEPHDVASTQRTELGELLCLRDTTWALIDAEAAGKPDPILNDLRVALNDRYDRYHDRFGPVNRSTVTVGKVNVNTGEAPIIRRFPRMGGFRTDPSFAVVLALEQFDDDSGIATKATIFRARTIRPRPPVQSAGTVPEAIAVSLDRHGRIDVPTVADLLDLPSDRAAAVVEEHSFRDPASGNVVVADEYLSGNVRTKLVEARAAHTADPDGRWRRNVDALRTAMPEDLGPGQIDASFGAPWIPPADIETFIGDVVGIRDAVVHHDPVVAAWEIATPAWQRQSVAATATWGTSRKSAVELIDAALNQRPVTVWDTLPDDRRVVNDTETMAARDKLEQLTERFRAWVWEQPERVDRLCAVYNERFNSIVLRRFDGTHLQLPGLADWFTPHKHQRDAVWRILCEGDTLLAHAVGAGKTATMVIAAVEQRRLGLINKPCFVVPNHMLEQFTREFLQLYPQANILAANLGGTTPDARRRFVAQCATGDWDAIILPRESFRSIPVSRATETAYLTRRVDELEDALSTNTGRPKVKEVEKALAREKARLQRLLNASARDDGITFEQTGIDHLLIDEGHTFKGKRIATRIPDVAGTESQRATDLDMKLTWLRSKNPGRVVTIATGTPIANAISEMWVMQTYLQPDVLTGAGVEQFDAWAATFASTVTNMELKPSGDGYAQKTRFARYRNVPELLRLFHANADVRTTADLNLPIPTVTGGGETIAVPATDTLRAYVTSLVERAEHVKSRRVDPATDNMLKITGDGRKAALHLRLVAPPTPTPSPGETTSPPAPHRPPGAHRSAPTTATATNPLADPNIDPFGDSSDGFDLTQGELGFDGKIAVCAARIAEIHQTHAERTYPTVTPGDKGGELSPIPGAFQIVFCDIGTPKPGGGWSVYQHLRTLLHQHGLPDGSVRFIHEARNDREKAELFAACRDGRINVLIGSTEKMGVGTNIQDRAIALHHLDCPWRPADLEQREGRILRQGNHNTDVHVIRYVTEGSFDVFMWATVTRKARFLAQVMTSNPDAVAREIDDVGDQALTYAQVTAIATGNPLIVEKAELDQDAAKLRRLQTAHQTEQALLQRRISGWETDIERLTTKHQALTHAETTRRPTTGEQFRVTHPNGRPPETSRTAWGEGIRTTIINHATPHHRNDEHIHAGTLGGLPITIHIPDQRQGHGAYITIEATRQRIAIDRTEALAADPVGLTRRVEHLLDKIPQTIADTADALEDTRHQHTAATARLGIPFAHADQLATTETRRKTIETVLNPPAPPIGIDNPAIGSRPKDPAQPAVTPPTQTGPQLGL